MAKAIHVEYPKLINHPTESVTNAKGEAVAKRVRVMNAAEEMEVTGKKPDMVKEDKKADWNTIKNDKGEA